MKLFFSGLPIQREVEKENLSKVTMGVTLGEFYSCLFILIFSLSVSWRSNIVLDKTLCSCSPDQPNVDVPEETVSDEELELTCYAPDNCPSMTPQIQWMYTDYLPDPEFSSEYLANDNSAVVSSTLSFTPRPMHNGQLLGCRVYYPNTTLVYERLISLDIKCKLNTI